MGTGPRGARAEPGFVPEMTRSLPASCGPACPAAFSPPGGRRSDLRWDHSRGPESPMALGRPGSVWTGGPDSPFGGAHGPGYLDSLFGGVGSLQIPITGPRAQPAMQVLGLPWGWRLSSHRTVGGGQRPGRLCPETNRQIPGIDLPFIVVCPRPLQVRRIEGQYKEILAVPPGPRAPLREGEVAFICSLEAPTAKTNTRVSDGKAWQDFRWSRRGLHVPGSRGAAGTRVHPPSTERAPYSAGAARAANPLAGRLGLDPETGFPPPQ